MLSDVDEAHEVDDLRESTFENLSSRLSPTNRTYPGSERCLPPADTALESLEEHTARSSQGRCKFCVPTRVAVD